MEDLCWEIISDKYGPYIHQDVFDFVDSLERNSKRTFSHKTKALLHTYFAVTEGLISTRISIASEAGAFDWSSPMLVPLRSFIKSMI